MANEFLGNIIKRVLIAEDTYEVTISLDRDFHFLSGQYIWIVIDTLILDDPRGNRRAFSITSTTKETRSITVIFRTSDSGFKKTLLNISPDVKVKILGPFGSSYIVDPEFKERINFFAGGVGIAPFLSILRSYSSEQLHSRIRLFVSHSNPEKAPYANELEEITKKNNLEYIPCIGRCSENLLPDHIDYKNELFYICGPEGYVNTLSEILTKKGVSFPQMHFEQFYPSPQGNLTEEDFILKPGQHNIMLQAVEHSRNHVIITDANGKIIFANKTAENTTGYTFNEMRDNTPRLWGGLMSANFYHSFWINKHKLTGFDGEITNRRKNGEIYYVITHISPIINDTNTIIGYIGTEEDITERVMMEKQILTQNKQITYDKQKHDAMLASIGEGLVAHNEEETVVLINDAALELLGFSREEIVGKKFVDIVKAEIEEGVLIAPSERDIHKVFLSNEKIVKTHIYIRKDGSKCIALVTNTPIIENGKTIGVIQVLRDVTKEKQIDKMKTEFISLASHQLRTPLSTINWYLEMLLDGDAGQVNAEQKKFLEEAYLGSHRMTALVNALLNVARIESGTFIVEPVLADLVKITRSVLDELKVQIDDRELIVTLEKVDLPMIPLDVELIRIVIQNLLTNAIKYTNPKGHISVFLKKVPAQTKLTDSITTKEDSFLLQVTDTGIGIPKSQQSRIFSKLYRADNVMKTDTEGTGLGLYILKNIIEQSKGNVWFDSTENVGSNFYVCMPLRGMPGKAGSKKLN